MDTWKSFNRRRNKHLRNSRKIFNRVFTKVRMSFRNELLRTGDAITALNSISSETIKEGITEAYNETYTTTGVDFAEATYLSLENRQKGLNLKRVNNLDLIWAEEMLRFVKEECADKIQSVTRSLIESITEITKVVVAESIEEGWGPAKVAKEIFRRTGTDQKWRVERIARTEVNGGSNRGSYVGAGSHSVKVRKIWLVNVDSETRNDHAGMSDAKHIAYNEKWQVGPDMMLHPHDPNASKGNIINCRCGITYEPEEDVIDQILNDNYNWDQ